MFCEGLEKGYIERDIIEIRSEWINKWKIFTPRANNIGTELSDDNFNIRIGEPGTICTESYIVIGADEDYGKSEAEALGKYLQTKFSRFLHSLAKGSQDATSKPTALSLYRIFRSNQILIGTCQIQKLINSYTRSINFHKRKLVISKKYKNNGVEIALLHFVRLTSITFWI